MRLLTPEKFVLFMILVFGLIACLATPLSAGYDEETHFIRAWEMAHLYFVPNEQLGARLPFPALYWDLSYRRQPIIEAVEPGFWGKYGALPMDASDYVYANVETRSVYSPVLLLPQAITLRYLGLSLQLPALPVYYACRIAGLLSYLILSWMAVRLIPFGKWLLAILIISPMAIFQASTISADTISNGIGFFFVAASLVIAQGRTSTRSGMSAQEVGTPGRRNRQTDSPGAGRADAIRGIDRRQWLLLLGLIALLFVGKVNLIFLVLLPFLLIAPDRFRMRHGYLLLAAAALGLFLVEVVGWNAVAYSKFTRALQGADPREQLLFMLGNPLLFLKIVAQDIWVNTPAYMHGWIGVYGYDYWPVPALVYLLYPLAAILSLWPPPGSPRPDRRARVVLASLFVAGFLLTVISLYVAFTPVRSLTVAGVQGRYFTVVMPLLFLSLMGFALRGTPKGHRGGLIGVSGQAGRRGPHAASSVVARHLEGAAKQRSGVPVSVPILLFSSALLLYTIALLLSYHVPCGSEYYQWSLCYMPQYKNWAPEAVSSPPVSSDLTLTQEIVPACNGITELSVWVNSAGTDPSATTTLTLRAPTQEKDLIHRAFANAAIAEGDWLTVTFPPEWKSGDQLYILQLSGSSPGGIRVGYSEKPEYLAGRLFENHSAKGRDILFQYGCVAGLQKLTTIRQ